jgi:hypothetical protein
MNLSRRMMWTAESVAEWRDGEFGNWGPCGIRYLKILRSNLVSLMKMTPFASRVCVCVRDATVEREPQNEILTCERH